MTEPEPSPQVDSRNTLNRLATLAAGQDQLATDVAKVRGGVQMILLVQLYLVATAALIFLLLRYPQLVKGATK